ncbi:MULTISPECIES: nucleoside triphosphate pyrophosphohydrolase [Cytobacillus]|uniref:nucleoside triphosphate pyrophosphohydrolase n=1 Tax=Cytobacillus TaxID=2675230 RepID=UPI00203ADB79|nr:nucleoside triphosphate pyrophosphohydrolase [Cytobacillus firmus]MCM3704669.1 nucleoside triphosphate pyrophosphohydrolase [Cytobacillus firmus]URM34794.1 nucleoside triphosphate pyrophosphohydrolase [Cytobacillus firmus]
MPIYNKLVRDRIPEVITRNGKTCSTRILDNEEYIEELKKKSFEELEEYVKAQTDEEAMEELADILEILHALAKVHGSTIRDVDDIRKSKVEKRGGFRDKVFLIEVED